MTPSISRHFADRRREALESLKMDSAQMPKGGSISRIRYDNAIYSAQSDRRAALAERLRFLMPTPI